MSREKKKILWPTLAIALTAQDGTDDCEFRLTTFAHSFQLYQRTPWSISPIMILTRPGVCKAILPFVPLLLLCAGVLAGQATAARPDRGTGLDYFGARYDARTQGRFTSADPMLMDAERIADPQLINSYVYAGNNPRRFIDPADADPPNPKKPKIEIKYEHYEALGSTPAEAVKNARKQGLFAPSPYEAQTIPTSTWEGKITYTRRPTSRGYLATATGKNLRVVMTLTVITPQWQSSNSNSELAASQNQAFQNYSSSVQRHEDGHVQLYVAAANELQERVNGVMVTGNGADAQAATNDAIKKARSEIDAIIQDVGQRLDIANANYDQVTEHGMHQERAPTTLELPKRGP